MRLIDQLLAPPDASRRAQNHEKIRGLRSTSKNRSQRKVIYQMISFPVRILEIKKELRTASGSDWLLIEWRMRLPVSNDSEAFYVFGVEKILMYTFTTQATQISFYDVKKPGARTRI